MDISNEKNKKVEVIFWSIALPGFGQLLNRKYVKGIVLIIFEIMINVKGNINIVIMKSFLGETKEAILQADYLWLMFYPCVYLFALWDAYRDAGGNENPYMFFPFVFSAFIGTIGVIYSKVFAINGWFIGPVFLPIIGMSLGFLVGIAIKKIVVQKNTS